MPFSGRPKTDYGALAIYYDDEPDMTQPYQWSPNTDTGRLLDAEFAYIVASDYSRIDVYEYKSSGFVARKPIRLRPINDHAPTRSIDVTTTPDPGATTPKMTHFEELCRLRLESGALRYQVLRVNDHIYPLRYGGRPQCGEPRYMMPDGPWNGYALSGTVETVIAVARAACPDADVAVENAYGHRDQWRDQLEELADLHNMVTMTAARVQQDNRLSARARDIALSRLQLALGFARSSRESIAYAFDCLPDDYKRDAYPVKRDVLPGDGDGSPSETAAANA